MNDFHVKWTSRFIYAREPNPTTNVNFLPI